MSSGVALRTRGARKPTTQKPSDFLGPHQSLAQTGRPGEKKLNRQQIEAIQHLYRSHPAISAARAVLHGQLLSSGIVLKRGGETVELKAAFKSHLDETWVPFAADVVDNLLMFGYVVVVYDEDDASLQKQRVKRLKQAKGGKAEEPVNYVPMVPTIDTYDLSYVHTGKSGYKRQYLVHATAPGQTARIDDEARVVIRTHPDVSGNINSPMAVVFDQGSFISALAELALQAETTNSRPRLWAQMRQQKTGTALDPQALFFDSASRDVQSSQSADDNQNQLQALALQQQLCSVINKLQSGPGTGNGLDVQTGSFSGGGDQEAMNAAGQMPQTRGDLEALSRLAIEQISAALGVPADLLFNDGEEDGDDPAQLMLLTAPLASTEEVATLYAAGLAPIEVAMPAALHAIGASKDEIERATREAKEREEKKQTCVDCQEEEGKIGLELQNEEKRISNGNLPEKQKLDLEQQKESIRASKEASKEKASGSGGGGSSGGGK